VRAGDDDLLPRVEEALRTGSLFGGAPVAVVFEADALDDDQQRGLLALIPEDGGAHLVLVATAPDMRRRLYATCARKDWAFEFRKLPPARMGAWLREEAARRGRTLVPEAGELLVDLVGTDLRMGANEIEKLSLYVPAGRPIDAAAVGSAVGSFRARSMLELADNLQRRNLGAAVALVRQLIVQGSQPIAIVAFLAGQIRRMLAATSLLHAGLAPDDVGRRLGVSSWVAGRLCEGARRYDAQTLRRALLNIGAVDVALKSSRLPPERVLESWVLGLDRTRTRA
jgi:DNA polymerase-3 subunit delta